MQAEKLASRHRGGQQAGASRAVLGSSMGKRPVPVSSPWGSRKVVASPVLAPSRPPQSTKWGTTTRGARPVAVTASMLGGSAALGRQEAETGGLVGASAGGVFSLEAQLAQAKKQQSREEEARLAAAREQAQLEAALAASMQSGDVAYQQAAGGSRGG